MNCGVSIRLADAWPFQPQRADAVRGRRASFNPPCGCVAFSTAGAASGYATSSATFQSALRMRGLFNPRRCRAGAAWCPTFQSALRMRGLFNSTSRGSRRVLEQFQSALRMRGLFNRGGSATCMPIPPSFQSALRMRGLFNHPDPQGAGGLRVGFNPPCGCVAFSTSGVRREGPQVVGFNPPCGCVAFSTRRHRPAHESASQGFNPPCGCVAFSTA